MKYINKFSVAVISAAALVGCNNLDMEPVGSTVTEEQKSEVLADNPEMSFASVTGMAGMMDLYNQLGGDYHYDFGMPAWLIWTDMRGMDMYSVQSGYNWFLSAESLGDAIPGNSQAGMPWTYCYNIIRSANDILSANAEALENPSDETMFATAQAYAFRAYAYFTLAQMFQFTYVGNEAKPCVPLITDKNAVEAAAEGCPISSVEEVYKQIMDDLNTAVDFLSKTSVKASQLLTSKPNRLVSLAAAQGLRARVNLVMNKWANAQADAQAAINNFSGAPKSIKEASVPTFTSLDESDWMWGIAVAETDRCVTTGICNFPSHMGSFCYGYATAVGAFKWINNSLWAQIPVTDCRKGWWLDPNGTSDNLSADQQEYVTSVGATAYVQVKYNSYQGILDQSVNASDIPLMRVEEMYLILAEAQGMQNAAAGAATLANFVKTYRDPNYTCSATTAQELQDAVYFQRRIELWGEGFSYYDLMRLKKTLDRRNGGWPADYTYVVESSDPVLIYPFPQSEITANKALTDADNNNRGGGMPTPVR